MQEESPTAPAAPIVVRGLTIFDGGFSCAEAVFLAGMERLGIEDDLVPKLATGFGGGVSRTESLCGALAGGVMVLGAAHGRTRPEDDRAVILSRVQELMRAFRERFGSDNCYTLTGLDFNQPGALDVYKQRVHGQCQVYVRSVLESLHAWLPPPPRA